MRSDVENWLRKLPEGMPIRAQTESVYGKGLQELLENQQSLIGSEREGMLWLRIGWIDRAHEIVQSATNGTGAYIHGMVHRLEGDYWNAKYWFRRVDDAKLLNNIKEFITGHSGETSFDPTKFTDRVESWDRNNDPAKHSELAHIATLEWHALWSLLNDEPV